jgi:hypothetical protein
MAGRFGKVTSFSALFYLGLCGFHGMAQTTPAAPSAPFELPKAVQLSPGTAQPAASPSATPGQTPKKDNVNDAARKFYESMSPDQQKKFQDNYERWQQMSPEEKRAMRDRERERREKMSQEIETTIKQSGLVLDQAAHQQYVDRYMQERRRIEQALQKDMEEKRKPLLQEMMFRLKNEFVSRSGVTSPASELGAAAPTATPSTALGATPCVTSSPWLTESSSCVAPAPSCTPAK